MKKLISGLMLAALTCSSAYAATSSKLLTAGTSNAIAADGNGCLILATAVKIGLSSKVGGSVFCRESDGTDPSMIMVGTCHEGGLSKIRSVTCINKGTSAAPDWFPTDCTGTGSVSINGPSLFMADTATGGAPIEDALGDTCSSANVKTYVDATAATYATQ